MATDYIDHSYHPRRCWGGKASNGSRSRNVRAGLGAATITKESGKETGRYPGGDSDQVMVKSLNPDGSWAREVEARREEGDIPKSSAFLEYPPSHLLCGLGHCVHATSLSLSFLNYKMKIIKAQTGNALAIQWLGLPRWLGSKRDTEDTGSIPGLGRSPEGGNDSPLQYSCPQNPMERGV